MSLSCYLLYQITLGSPTEIFSFLHELSEVRIFRYFSASDSSSKKEKVKYKNGLDVFQKNSY